MTRSKQRWVLAIVAGVIGAAAGVWFLEAMGQRIHVYGDVSRGPLRAFFAWEVSPGIATILYGLTGLLLGLALGLIVSVVATRRRD